MFDSILSMFIKQLGTARFSIDRAVLVVKFANRTPVRVALAAEDAAAVIKGARDLANTIEAMYPAAAPGPAANGASERAAEAPAADPKPTPAKPKAPAAKK